MKEVKLVVILLLVCTFAKAQKATDNFSGNWKTEDGKEISITKSGNSFTAVGSDNIKSKTVIEDLKFSNNEWNGTMIRPKDGLRLKCTAILDGSKMKITAQKGMMSKTIIWTR